MQKMSLKKYPSHIEAQMRTFFNRLDEKNRRLYAALESQKLPHGGVDYLSKLLGIDPKTIRAGLNTSNEKDSPNIRKKGVVEKVNCN